MSHTIDHYFELNKIESIFVKYFQVYGHRFSLRFKNFESVADADTLLIQIFNKVLNTIFGLDSGATPRDRVGLTITHPKLNKTFIEGFHNREEYSGERILAIVTRLLHSDEMITLNDTFEIQFTRIKDR